MIHVDGAKNFGGKVVQNERGISVLLVLEPKRML